MKMTDWTPCDTPPSDDRWVLLTTCSRLSELNRSVYNARFDGVAWWHRLGARIQDIPVSWRDKTPPEPDYTTKPDVDARMAEVEKSCAIMRGELNIE